MRPMEKSVLNKINPARIFWGVRGTRIARLGHSACAGEVFCGDDTLPIMQKNFWSLDLARQNKNFQTTS